MIAALNELSGGSSRALRSPPATVAATGGFGALLATAAPRPAPAAAPALPVVPPGSLAPFPVEAGSAAVSVPAQDAPAADPKAGPPLPASAPQPSSAVAPNPWPQQTPPEADTPPADAAKPARKPGPADENRVPTADTPGDPGQPGFAAPAIGPIAPTLLPPARAEDPVADQDATAAADTQAMPHPGAPGPSDAAAPTGDPATAPTGDFRALLATPPASQTTPPAKSALTTPRDRAAPPVARGDQLGLQIVRHIDAGKEALSVSLTPESLGRVEVQLRFDESGTLRASVSASTPEALALLHRDSALLDQALTGAGVRTDAQSFRFDAHAGEGDARQPGARDPNPREGVRDLPDSAEAAVTQPLRSSGMLDLLA